MTDEELGGIVIGFIFKLIIGLLILLFIRWFFRINEIADSLKRLADRLAPEITPRPESPIKQAQCTFCHKYFPPDKLTKTDSGDMACPTCAKSL